MECIKIIGNKTYFSGFCGLQKTNEKIEMIVIKPKKEVVVNTEYYGNNNIPKLVNGKFTIMGYNVWVDDIRECTKDEISILQQEIDKHNMYWGEISFKKYSLNGTPCGQVKYPTLLWKEKDLFPIVLNGQRITYKELKDRNVNGYFTMTWDNGYSYCCARSETFEKVYNLIDRIFRTEEEITLHEKCTTWFFALNQVYCGDRCGYTFDEVGALVLNVTSAPIEPISEISNT